MTAPIGSVTINPQGVSMAVTVSGGSVYTTLDGTTQPTFPATISTATTYYMPKGDYTVTTTLNSVTIDTSLVTIDRGTARTVLPTVETFAEMAAVFAPVSGSTSYVPRTTRRVALQLASGGSNGTTSQADVNDRYPIRVPLTTTQWRVKVANYDAKNNAALNALTCKGIWFGTHSVDAVGAVTGNFTAAPTNIVAGDFTIPGNGTQYTSAWITDPALQMSPGVDYLLSIAATTGGAATPMARGANTTVWRLTSTVGGTAAPGSLTVSGIAFFDVMVEYETITDAPMGAAFGDSLTENLSDNPGLPAYNTWPQIVARRAGGAATVSAISGSVTNDWNDTTKFRWTRHDWATYAPDWVALFIGSNDAAASLAIATWQGYMATLVANIRTTLPTAKRLYIVTIPPRGLTTTPEAVRVSYNAWLSGNGLNGGLPLLASDLWDFDRALRSSADVTVLDADFKSSDGVHLLQRGYAKAAQVAHIRLRT